MSSHVGLYFDSLGNLAMIVRPHYDIPGRVLTEADFAPHDADQSLRRVTIDTAKYKSAAPPINNRGAPFYYGHCQKALPDIQAKGLMKAGLDVTMIQHGNVAEATAKCSALAQAIEEAIDAHDGKTVASLSKDLVSAKKDLSLAKDAQKALADVVIAIG